MNSRLPYACLQVARTYWHRPRFWCFGLPYLLVALVWAPRTRGVDISVAVLTSVLTAAMIGSFVALHLRRQFGSPAAKVIPGFATAHLLVGMAAGLLIWAGVPAVQAALVGVPWWGPVGAHAIAGIYLSLRDLLAASHPADGLAPRADHHG